MVSLVGCSLGLEGEIEGDGKMLTATQYSLFHASIEFHCNIILAPGPFDTGCQCRLLQYLAYNVGLRGLEPMTNILRQQTSEGNRKLSRMAGHQASAGQPL